MSIRTARALWIVTPAIAFIGMAATPALSLRPVSSDRVELSWPADAAGFALEQAESLTVTTPWSAVSVAPSTAEGRAVVTLTPGSQTRYFRLTGNPPTVTRIVETSPAAGETGVSVTRETILRFSGPLAATTLLRPDDFHAEFGGRRWLTRAELSSDRRSATLFFLENLPASSRMRVVMSGDLLLDAAGVALDADGDGQPGGVRVLEFDTGGVAGVAATAVIGRVFAAEKLPDGSNRPLPNTTITVNGAEESLRTTTDASGFFRLEPAPAGRFFVHVDGRTAQGSHWPGGAYYPYVGKAWEAVAGKTNNLAGGTGEIFLPLIQNDALKVVSPTTETRVTFSPAVVAANPALAGVEILVPPNALFSDNGTRGGMVGIAPVPADRLPEPLPAGLTLPLVITIQTDGAANFDQPVPVKFPNLPDPRTGRTAGPGETTVLWSFNHDSGHWEAQGTMTVSADGKFAVSDPGVGVRQPGWHGSSPGGPAGGPGRSGGGGPGCPPYCGPQPDPPCSDPDPCGPAHYAYQEKYDEWRDAVKLGGLLSGKAVNLGKEVDALYRAYADCRETQGWPCEGPAPAAPASGSTVRSTHAWARTSAGSEAEIRWNDAIRTGIEEQNHASFHSPLPGPGAWFALESLETGFIQRGQLNSAGAAENLFVAPEELYQLSYYDAVNRRSGSVTLRSQLSGLTTYLPYALLIRVEGGSRPDSDGDGLSDVAEFIVATAPNKADSDADGIPDGRELSLGSNPLDGVGLPLGIVAQVATPGKAESVVAEDGLALVSARNGLAVFDVSDPRKPTQVSVIQGATRAAALRGRLALAAFADRVVLLDLSTPASPQIRWVRNVANVGAVAFGRGDSVWVSGPSSLQRWELESGETTGEADDGARGESLLVRGGQVYVLAGARLTWVVDGDVLTTGGSLQVPGSGGAGGVPRRLAAIGNRLYTQHNSGFNVVDVTDPESPLLLTTVNTRSQGWRLIAPIRPDLALVAVGPNSTDDGPHDVSLYSLGPEGTNAVFLTTLTTPGSAYSVAVAGGMGYVADGLSGLAVVNGLAPDVSGVSPTVALELENPALPPRVQAGTLVRLGAEVQDDVAVRVVEFWINGARVARDDALPFELFHAVPPLGTGPGQFVVQLRAEDMAGNVAVSPETTILVVPDATAPRILRLMPPPGSEIVPGVVTEVSVEFDEPISNPAIAQGITVLSDGPDGILDTADDAVVLGSVQFDATRRSLVWTTPSALTAADHRVTLPVGFSDDAGNSRRREVSWRIDTGGEPYVADVFPPKNYVQVGGTLDELRLTFNQPLPDILAATYVLAVSYRQEPGQGAFVPVAPLIIERDRESRVFTLRTSGTFPPGEYRITGGGPNVQAMLWEFLFRTVGNEAVEVFGTDVAWKYFPGPGVEDELVVNVPGKQGDVNVQGIRSLIAHSDIRILRQTVNLPEPLQCFAGLWLANARLGPGVTHVRGPLQIQDVFGNEFTTIGAHTLNAYGGGVLRSEIRFTHPDGALVNHPGSVFELQGGMVANTGIAPENWGRLVNLGTLRNTGELGRLEDIRVRNDGRIEVSTGRLVFTDLEHEGVLDLATDSQLALLKRFRAGVSSSLTGTGAVELGAYDEFRRRVISEADAEFRGDLALTGPVTLLAGKAVLWRSFHHPDQTFAVQNGGVLEFLSPADFGTLDLRGAIARFRSAARIRFLAGDSGAELESGEEVTIHGDNQVIGLTVLGTGLVDFTGSTLVSNRNSQVGIRLGHGSLRNSGVWTHAVNNNNGSELLLRRVDGDFGRGAFENTGIFTQTVAKPLLIGVPFLNSGLAEFGEGPLVLDSRSVNGGLGVYRPQPGGELVLNATQIQNQNGGALDLAAGTLRGTGTIRCNSTADGPQVINRAVLQPGNPLGSLTIRSAGAFEQTATGELVATLAPSDSSRLVLQSVRAILAGRLRIVLADGFSPAVGQSFDVLTFSGRTGEFSEVLLPALGAGKKLEVAYSSSAVTVRVVAN